MKKWFFIVFAIAVALLLSFIYLFIPGQERYSFTLPVKCTYPAMQRFILNSNNWSEWWPGKKTGNDEYIFDGVQYRINKIILDGFDVNINNGEDAVRGFLSFEPVADDVSIHWKSVFKYPANPVSRLHAYFSGKAIKNNVQNLLLEMQNHFNDEKNIYGFTASVTKVTDEFLVSIREQMDHYPSTQEVYSMVADIRNYIRQKGGVEKNPPMLNVFSESANSYLVMVAIPTTSSLPAEGKFLYKQMVLGNIVVAEVKGGLYTVSEAEKQMQLYITDHKKMSPAIPFQSLVTERIAENDTAKWVTKLYYPVFF